MVSLWRRLPLWAASYYLLRLEDAKAAYDTPERIPVHCDGVTGDTDDIQAASLPQRYCAKLPCIRGCKQMQTTAIGSTA